MEDDAKAKKSKSKKSTKGPDSKFDYEMRSISLIKKGQEIYNTYGDLSNGELLLKYGFVEDEPNPFDYVDISFSKARTIIKSCLKNDKKYKSRFDELIERQIIDDPEEEFHIEAKKAAFPPPLTFVIKCFVAGDKEWASYIRAMFEDEADEEVELDGHSHSHSHDHGEICESFEEGDESDEEQEEVQEEGSGESDSIEDGEDDQEEDDEVYGLMVNNFTLLKEIQVRILLERQNSYSKSKEEVQSGLALFSGKKYADLNTTEAREFMSLVIRSSEMAILEKCVTGLNK